MRLKATFVIAALTIVQPLFAATNPWLGTWKLNRDKSTLTGNTTTVQKTPNGYHFDYAAVKYDVIEDGQDHEVMPGRVASLKSTGTNEWLQVLKIGGKEVSRSTLKLSDDGKTLTQTTTGTTAAGDTYKAESKMSRLDTSTGLAGTWKTEKESSSAKTVMVYSDAGAGKLRMEFPESKSSVTVALDGSPATETGPRVMKGETFEYKKLSDTEAKFAVKVDGKPYVEGTETISADGKMLKDVSWLVTKPAEKEVEVFEKQ